VEDIELVFKPEEQGNFNEERLRCSTDIPNGGLLDIHLPIL
jgi:hypothetical protein